MTDKHPCFHFNRDPFPEHVSVPDGYVVILDRDTRTVTRVQRMTTVPNPMSKECQQWGEFGWARIQGWDCTECQWYPGEQEGGE